MRTVDIANWVTTSVFRKREPHHHSFNATRMEMT
jgi:hypothetical protein